jgi:hypothetical protein
MKTRKRLLGGWLIDTHAMTPLCDAGLAAACRRRTGIASRRAILPRSICETYSRRIVPGWHPDLPVPDICWKTGIV